MNLFISYLAAAAFLLGFTHPLQAQTPLQITKDIKEVYVSLHWGELKIRGTEEDYANLSLSYTATSKQKTKIEETSLKEYISIKREGKRLIIFGREPQVFESIDIELEIPKNLHVQAQILKGGNIVLENLQNGIEIDNRNGSIQAKDIGGYALVNAANGEIKLGFNFLDPLKPVSLITLNGGIELSLPADCKRDLRLISRKNGHLKSEFDLGLMEKGIPDQGYSKEAISLSSSINGGGALLFLSTENGPVSIRKNSGKKGSGSLE